MVAAPSTASPLRSPEPQHRRDGDDDEQHNETVRNVGRKDASVDGSHQPDAQQRQPDGAVNDLGRIS
jgi:hypothetical protein